MKLLKIKDFQHRISLIDLVEKTIDIQGIEPYSHPYPEELTKLPLYHNLDPADAWILSAAIHDGASNLVTIDPNLLELKEVAGVQIKHPKEFVIRQV